MPHAIEFSQGFERISFQSAISEVGVFVTILFVFYSDLMKWIQKCEEPPRCFLASFDMIFTRICEIRPHAADISQIGFCLHFYRCFQDFDEI